MIAVIFEVEPSKDGYDTYLEHAARLKPLLEKVEQVVRHAQAHGVPATAAQLRPRTGPDGGERWVRLRVNLVVAFLVTLHGLSPDVFPQCRPRDVGSYALVLGTSAVLPALRGFVEPSALQKLVKPVGLRQCKLVHKPP